MLTEVDEAILRFERAHGPLWYPPYDYLHGRWVLLFQGGVWVATQNVSFLARRVKGLDMA